jgi:hypothetical protein
MAGPRRERPAPQRLILDYRAVIAKPSGSSENLSAGRQKSSKS